MDRSYRTVLVTGASSGIGRALSLYLAAQGVRVFAAARRLDALTALQDEAKGLRAEIVPVGLDVTDAAATRLKILEIDRDSAGLDCVVANAGVGLRSNARDLDWSSVEKTIAVNVTGAVATLSAAIPSMVKRGFGHLVGISSLSAFVPIPSNAAYCGSKAFLSAFLESTRLDLEGTGVGVTVVHPGFVQTELTGRSNHSRPLIMKATEAAQLIGEAIMNRQAELSFPWQLSLAARAGRMVPPGVQARALRWLKPRRAE